VLVEQARRFDALAGADAFVSRISSDEFVLLLEGKSDVELGCFAELLPITVARPITIDEAAVVVGASVGVASCAAAGTTAADLLRNAASAMYAAKAAELPGSLRDQRGHNPSVMSNCCWSCAAAAIPRIADCIHD
jgi:GGDEF domain-containing protein